MTLPVSTKSRPRYVPVLPKHPTDEWHSQTVRWWRELWTSSLPDAWQKFDVTSLHALALCFNDIWIALSATARKEALGEYRLQRKDFFIAPYNRLQGEIVFEEAEAAKDRGAERRKRSQTPKPAASSAPPVDPRSVLHAVS